MWDVIKTLVVDFWATLAAMSPYLLFGFLVAGLLSVWISPALVRRHLGSPGLVSILKASAFGVPLPLCSCGVIPVSMSLRKSGAGKGATVAFLLSTPQTGIDSILVTYSLMGPIFMVIRPIVALVTGVVGGLGVGLFDRGNGRPDGADDPVGGGANDTKNADQPQPAWYVRALRHGFGTLARDIAKPMLIGVFAAALIGALVPDDFFAETLGTGLGAMLILMVAGIPMYVCATASVPIAVALIAKGVSPGAALVFLMTGPATNAAGFATLWGVLGRRSAMVYLGSVVVCALGAGLVVDKWFPDLGLEVQSYWREMSTPWWGHVAAVTLLFVLVHGIATQKRGQKGVQRGSQVG